MGIARIELYKNECNTSIYVKMSLSSVKNDENLINKVLTQMQEARALAVCMAAHKRLGSESWLQVIHEEILQKIVQEYASPVTLRSNDEVEMCRLVGCTIYWNNDQTPWRVYGVNDNKVECQHLSEAIIDTSSVFRRGLGQKGRVSTIDLKSTFATENEDSDDEDSDDDPVDYEMLMLILGLMTFLS